MEEELHHPISRNLFRQSSIETPLSPSIPSDSDSEDDDKSDRNLPKKDEVSPKNDDSTQEGSSMNKLRERFEHVGLIKVMPNVEPAASIPENQIAGSAKDHPIYSHPVKEKPKPAVKPKTAGKKSIPSIPCRSGSLQGQITATNALLKGESQSHYKTPGPIKVVEDLEAKNLPGNDRKTEDSGSGGKEKKKPDPPAKPKTAAKKSIPSIPIRSDSLQSQMMARNALVLSELQGHAETSAPNKVAEDSEAKNLPGNDRKVEESGSQSKETQKPEVRSEQTGSVTSKKIGPPPSNARSDSLPKPISSTLMNELRSQCDKSDEERAQSVFKNVPESEKELEIIVETEDDDDLHAGKGDTMQSVSTIRAIPVMASPRPKSPRPVPVSAKKDEKEESFWEKIGTLGRKKRIKEVQEVQEEGKYAIDSPGLAANPDMPPEEYTLDENEERSMTDPRSLEDPKLQELIFVLIEWINDELADQRIIVKDIAEDLYDGQVLQKLLERLTGGKLDVPEVTQSEEGQKQKLAVVLSAANRVLDRYPPYKWSVDSVHSKNIVSILHLLVGLARQFRAPVRLPERVAIQVVVVRKKDGQLIHRTVREEITSTYEDLGMRCERDAFDTLFDHAPEKLAVVKKSLVSFVNKHLSKVHLEVTELDTQFHDGVFLTLLLGLLEGFFVPLGCFHLTPQTHDQKVHNVSFAFDLMQEIGLVKPKARPEDIVNLDLKSTLRVLYNLFTKYKGMN